MVVVPGELPTRRGGVSADMATIVGSAEVKVTPESGWPQLFTIDTGVLRKGKTVMLFGVIAMEVNGVLQTILKDTGLLVRPATVACTTPVDAPVGIVAWI